MIPALGFVFAAAAAALATQMVIEQPWQEPRGAQRPTAAAVEPRFAAAHSEVMALKDAATPRLRAAEPEEAERLRDAARTEMAQAIAAQGLSVPQYNALVARMRSDPPFAARIAALAAE